MAHKVLLAASKLEVKYSDVEFVVSDDDGKIGTLKVSKGNVEWLPVGQQKGYKMTWVKFAELMEGAGKKVK